MFTILSVVPQGVPLTNFTVYPTEAEPPTLRLAPFWVNCMLELPIPDANAYDGTIRNATRAKKANDTVMNGMNL